MPAAVAGQLVTDAAHPGPFQAKLQDPADLVQVDVVLDGAHQGAADVVFGEDVESGQLGLQQLLAAQGPGRRFVEAVELEVDFQPVAHGRQLFHQARVAGQTDAVGVDHDGLDRLLIGVADQADQLGVQRRLAAGELQHIGHAFELDVAIDHAAIGGEVDVLAAGARLGEAHGTFEVAAGGDLDQGDAGVLLVFGTQAAVIGAALVGASAEGPGQAGRLAELVAIVPGDVGADEVLDEAVLGAVLAEIDTALAGDDLGIDEPPAVGTQTSRRAEEGVVSQIHCAHS